MRHHQAATSLFARTPSHCGALQAPSGWGRGTGEPTGWTGSNAPIGAIVCWRARGQNKDHAPVFVQIRLRCKRARRRIADKNRLSVLPSKLAQGKSGRCPRTTHQPWAIHSRRAEYHHEQEHPTRPRSDNSSKWMPWVAHSLVNLSRSIQQSMLFVTVGQDVILKPPPVTRWSRRCAARCYRDAAGSSLSRHPDKCRSSACA